MKYLITGGTGSFGRAFTEHLLKREDTERVAIFSRGEHAQADMADGIKDSRARFFIGDVRDRDRLKRAFNGIDVVIHAAALKRIEVGVYNPTEMVQTNIGGAINVIEAALDAKVKKVVALSTDKAWQPISPYGQSKALAETLFRNAYGGKTIFAVTRYGNVAGSRGSVIPKWLEMKSAGKLTVPVTDPNCTRFYMKMSEAVELVQRTIDTMKGGELNIPSLPAYRLGDLADVMGVEMDVVGLPDWEKRHEGMAAGNTSDIARRLTPIELARAVEEISESLRSRGMPQAGAEGPLLRDASTAHVAQRRSEYRTPPEWQWEY